MSLSSASGAISKVYQKIWFLVEETAQVVSTLGRYFKSRNVVLRG